MNQNVSGSDQRHRQIDGGFVALLTKSEISAPIALTVPAQRLNLIERYAMAIADALQVELGQSHRATKTLMAWTGVTDRTAKNWLSGTCGPTGEHLIQLVRKSDGVLATVLSLAERNDHLVGSELLIIKENLAKAAELIDDLFQ